MKTKNKNTSKDRSTDSRSRAAVKGALVWGTVYSTATTGAAYVIATNMDASAITLPNIMTDTMVMFYPFGAARGLLMWHARKGRRENRTATKNLHPHHALTSRSKAA